MEAEREQRVLPASAEKLKEESLDKQQARRILTLPQIHDLYEGKTFHDCALILLNCTHVFRHNQNVIVV